MDTRKELEQNVSGFNKHLKDSVKDMDIIILLRNCHPIYRKDYAQRLKREGEISDNEAKEFGA